LFRALDYGDRKDLDEEKLELASSGKTGRQRSLREKYDIDSTGTLVKLHIIQQTIKELSYIVSF
jgi:hypothetical protein